MEADIRRPFAGPAGKYLDRVLEAVNLPRESLFITNVIACHPPHDRDPLPEEVKACQHFLDLQLRSIKPKRILALGNFALKALTGKSGISTYRGKTFHLDLGGDQPTEVYATYHPSFVRKNPKMYPVLFTDLLKLKGRPDVHIPLEYIPVTDMSTFKQVASRLLASPEISFDLETEHLDPWTGAKLICISLSCKEGRAYVVPLEGQHAPWSVDERAYIYRILETMLSNPNIHIIAFNAKFDLLWMWTRGMVKAKCDFDPMMAGTLLDENLPHSLEATVQLYLDPEFQKLDPSNISSWPWEDTWPYAARDADYTLRLAHVLR